MSGWRDLLISASARACSMRWSIFSPSSATSTAADQPGSGGSLGGHPRAPACQDDARACAPGDHARQPLLRRSPVDQCLARLFIGERPERRGRSAVRRRARPPPRAAVFSRTHRRLRWQAAPGSGAETESIEIESSHCGMGHHPAAAPRGGRSPRAEGRPAGRPFDRSGWRSLVYPDPHR